MLISTVYALKSGGIRLNLMTLPPLSLRESAHLKQSVITNLSSFIVNRDFNIVLITYVPHFHKSC